MTKDQQATPIPEELFNLTQLADVTLAAGPLTPAAIGESYTKPMPATNASNNNSIFYASSDDDSTYNSYSHKIFDRKKQRRCTISDTNSCASLNSNSSNSSQSSVKSHGSSEEQSPVQASCSSSNSTSSSLLDDEHTCPECGKKYSTSSNLARHRQTHRSIMDKKARHCPFCEKVYVSMPAFSMHVRTHNQGCKCEYCGKCFSRPWLLQGHIRTHTGEKPFKCNVCSKAFADKSNLRAHIQTHSNTKPHTCARCGKAFALKSYLYKHEESSCMKNRSEGTTRAAAVKQSCQPELEMATTTTTSTSRAQTTALPASPDSAKSTLAHKLLQKENNRRLAEAKAQAVLAYGYPATHPDAFGRLSSQEFYESFKRNGVIQPKVLQHHPNAVYQEHLLPLPLPMAMPYQHYPHAAATTSNVEVDQEQPVDFSPKNNFTHSAKTSPFELTGNYAMVA